MKFLTRFLFFSIFSTSMANAAGGGTGWVFNPALFYQSLSITSGGSTASSSSTLIDARLGYVMSSNIYLGGYYNTTSDSSASSSLTDTAMGVDLGYYSGAFSAILTYILGADDQTSSTDTRKGKGFALTLGYAFSAGGWGFGPQLMYDSITWDKLVSSGTESTIDIKTSTILPRFAFWFHF